MVDYIDELIKLANQKYKIMLCGDDWHKYTLTLFNRISSNNLKIKRAERKLAKLEKELEEFKLPYLKGVTYGEKTCYVPSLRNDFEEHQIERANVEEEISQSIVEIWSLEKQYKSEFKAMEELIKAAIENSLIQSIMLCLFVDGLTIEETAIECYTTVSTSESYRFKGVKICSQFLKNKLKNKIIKENQT